MDVRVGLYKESWALKNWCFWTVVLEKTLEGPLDCKEIQPINSKGNQSWVFIGRTDVEAEIPILWPSNVKNCLLGKDWCWERLKARGEGDNRGWDGWMASLTRWTWVWVNSGSWWWTGRPGMLQSMRSQSRTRLSDWTEKVKVYFFFSTSIWCWERLKARGDRDNGGWDGWMVSLTQWAWVWVNSGSWWWTWKPGILQSMGSERFGQLSDWTELNCPL